MAYWFGNRAINAKVAAWTPTTVPGDWSAYRDQWEAAYAISATLGAIALICLLVATFWRPINSGGGHRVTRQWTGSIE